MDTELREPKQITATAEEERSPVFSPDGDSILFVSDRDSRSEIYRATRGDKAKFWWQNEHFKIERLTNDGEQKTGLAWSPDGSHVAFIKGRGELCVMTPDGKTIQSILKSFTVPEFDWSPDGKWLVYSADDADFNRDVFIVPIDSSKPPFNVSRHPRNDSNPVWSPDGKVIAFTGQRGDERDIFYVWLRNEDEEKASRDRSIEKAIEKMAKGRKVGDRDSDDAKTDTPRPRPEPRKPVVVSIDWNGLHDRIHRVSNPGVTETGLFWSADSKKLLFSATIDGKSGIYSIEIPDDLKPKSFTTQSLSHARWLRRGNQVVGLANGLPTSVGVDPLSGRPKA
ncbi:MAG TPA: hypothetical protein VKT80_19620, partial [Chloroflexota bacterium]|nr:hypothetical protein [Chloroflexota bacterium]